MLIPLQLSFAGLDKTPPVCILLYVWCNCAIPMPIFLCIRIEFISHSLFALPLLCHPPLSPSTHLLTPPPLLPHFISFTLPSSLLVYCDMLFAQTPHSPCPICQPLPKPSHPQVYCKKHTQKKKQREGERSLHSTKAQVFKIAVRKLSLLQTC